MNLLIISGNKKKGISVLVLNKNNKFYIQKLCIKYIIEITLFSKM
jgi:hypothetical protein